MNAASGRTNADAAGRSRGPDWTWPAGRVLVSLLFLVSGGLKLAFHDAVAGMLAARGLPLAGIGAWLAALLEVGGAIGLIFAVHLPLVAPMLAGWCLVTAGLFHQFWGAGDPAAQQAELFNFLKNVALAGALVIIAGRSTGR